MSTVCPYYLVVFAACPPPPNQLLDEFIALIISGAVHSKILKYKYDINSTDVVLYQDVIILGQCFSNGDPEIVPKGSASRVDSTLLYFYFVWLQVFSFFHHILCFHIGVKS
jgi:hypothetical protein